MVGKKLQGLATFPHWVAFIYLTYHSALCCRIIFFFAIVQHRWQLEFLCSNSPLLRMKSRNSKNDLNLSIEDALHLVSHIPPSMLCSPTYPIIPHTSSPDAWRKFHQGKPWKGSIWSTRNSRRSRENKAFQLVYPDPKALLKHFAPGFLCCVYVDEPVWWWSRCENEVGRTWRLDIYLLVISR